MVKQIGMITWRNGNVMRKIITNGKRMRQWCAIAIVVSFGILAVSSGGSSFGKQTSEQTLFTNPMDSLNDDSIFSWRDTFNNTEKIDDEYSENYLVENGQVRMYGTYDKWTDSSWTRMKPITLQTSESIQNCIFSLQVEYDSDMQADYDDLRFKFENETAYAAYWIEQRNPDPNNPYALLWIRLSNVPAGSSILTMFYGNPAAEEFSQYDAVFDETSWQKRFAHDEQVTYHMDSEGAWDPDVCWGDNLFLVTWEEGKPYNLFPPMMFQQQIRGCFYDKTGQKHENRFDITFVEDTPYRYENPSGASDDDIFFVAFEKYINPMSNQNQDRDLYGSIVTTDGSSTVFEICTASGIQADPQVVYDSIADRFLVIWEDGRQGTSNYNIYGQFFSDSGETLSDEIVLASRPHTQCEPWIAFDINHHHFYVVWEEGITPDQGPFDIWGQMFDSNLDPLGTALRLSEPATTNIDFNFPSVAYSAVADRFLVTWQQDDISSNDWTGPIFGLLLDSNGDVIDDIFLIESGEFERSTAVTYLTSSFFVAFDGGGDIWGQPVSSTGQIYDYIIQLSDGESDPADWASVGSNGEELFVAWEDLRIEYTPPYEGLDMPDVFMNIWSFNTPQSADVSAVFGTERSLILEATVVSYPIEPENLMEWSTFSAEKTGSVFFDILQGNTMEVLLSNISSGESLSSIQDVTIRLRARFARSNPSTSPVLDEWSVSFQGQDFVAPETTIDHIDGVEGLNGWYTSESVTVWLHAEDFPEQTGSGVKDMFYKLNNGYTQKYDEATGIHLSVDQEMGWAEKWTIVFWSVDRSGNVEDNTQSDNRKVIRIDAERPFISIVSPIDEEEVDVPFVVSVNATDNVEVTKVAFDIEPFGERPGFPVIDSEPPFEWTCDVKQNGGSSFSPGKSLGANVMIRARAFDASGQIWTHQLYVYITNWEDSDDDGFNNGIGFLAGFGHHSNKASFNPQSEGSPTCLVLGQLTWQFDEGVTFSVGNQGAYTMTGPQTGLAELFIGVANKDRSVFLGFAGAVFVD